MNLEYGHGKIELKEEQIPGRCTVLETTVRAEREREEIIREALAHPIGTKRLREIVAPSDSICIVVSDISRYYQRMDLFLPLIVEELSEAGVPDKNITMLCAMGSHGKQSDEEKRMVLGEELSGRFTLLEHDCRDEANLVNLGTSKNGTPLCFSRYAVEADKLILTGAVGFHDMAGYGGGRKSVLPGIASYEGVSKNHLQVFGKEPGTGLNPACHLGCVDGNPMHADMVEACELVKPDFMFNVILDTECGCYQAVAGDWREAFAAGMKYCDEACAIPVRERGDVVIAACGGYPKDMNLYQASKGYAVAIEAVKRGGTIILAADCEDGMGADESVEIIRDYPTMMERETFMRKDFIPEAYSGYYLCEMAQYYDLVLVSSYQNEEELAGSGMTLFHDMESALRYTYGKFGEGSSPLTYIIPHSMAVLPKLFESQAIL